MIVKSAGGDVDVKGTLLEDAWPYPAVPPEFRAGLGAGGGSGNPFWPFMSLDQAMGLPALLGVLLRISTAAGMLPQKVYAGEDQLSRQTATDTWQYELLHDRPTTSGEHTPFTLRADIALALAGAGYCCVRKFTVPDRNVLGNVRVAELLPLDSAKVRPVRRNGRLVFLDSTESRTPVERDSSEIIYVRAPASGGGVTGLAPVTLARLGLTTALKRMVFEGAYYDRSAEPRVVLAYPDSVNAAEAREFRDLWNENNQGLENAHGTAVTGGGATITTLPISMQDAQFVESTRMAADQWGFIYGMPKSFLNTSDQATMGDADWRYFTTFGLGWIAHAMDQAFTADRSLFPAGGPRMHVETVVDALLKPDIRTRYDAYKAARQAGWLTSNEVRALENYPPVDGGDVLQVTPVGGAIDNTSSSSDEAAKAELLDELEAQFPSPTTEQKLILTAARERARR